MTTIRFVATSVLSSDDGLSYKTEQLEDEEAHKKRLDKEKAAHGRTLWEQLEEQKDKKKAEYDAVTKQIFAPPKALDEGEASYLQGILEQEKMRDRRRAEEEERELAAFSLARANRDLGSNGEEMVAGGGKVPPREGAGGGGAAREETGGSIGGGGNSSSSSSGNKGFPDVKINAKVKRKEKSSKEGGKEGKEGKDSSTHQKKHKKEDKASKKAATMVSPATSTAAQAAPAAPLATAKPEAPAAAAANPLTMLAAYDSDEEED
eukprot:evm.model.NODE_11811_length_10454_cov_19.500383.4